MKTFDSHTLLVFIKHYTSQIHEKLESQAADHRREIGEISNILKETMSLKSSSPKCGVVDENARADTKGSVLVGAQHQSRDGQDLTKVSWDVCDATLVTRVAL